VPQRHKKAADLLRELGMTWEQVLAPAKKLPVSPERPIGVRQDISRALSSRAISAWERRFLIDISGRRHLSPKQRAVLDRILDRVQQ
jgi:hypothetical protein